MADSFEPLALGDAGPALGQAVADWFGDEGASLELPTGWVGRPYDELYRLSWWAARPQGLIVELDAATLVVLVEPGGVAREGNSLVVTGCSDVVVCWSSVAAGSSRVQRAGPGNLAFRRF